MSEPGGCKWCGGIASVVSNEPNKWFVVCAGKCSMEGPTERTPEDAIEAWDLITFQCKP
jgi:hypothetical protein